MRLNRFGKSAALAVLLLALGAAKSFAQTSGFDIARMDSSVQACDNFYQYANGAWLKKTEIPAAFPAWGSFDILQDRNAELARDILETSAKDAAAKKGSDEQLVGDYYAACMDTAAIEAAGAKPLDRYFGDINRVKNANDLLTEIARLHRSGVPAVFGFYAASDQRNSSMNIANLYQGGLSLPNRDYYTNADDKSKELREKFVAYAARMFMLLGDTDAQAKANADAVMRIETRLALASRTPVEERDPVTNFNKMSVADADKLATNFAWETYAAALGAPKFSEINVSQPDFFKEVNRMIADVSINDWKTYLRWKVANNFASRLAAKFDDEHFNFYGKVLNGTQEQQPRWKRCVYNADSAVGESLGTLYVKKNFTPEAKKRMDELITNLFAAYRERIMKLDWMTDATRAQALTKLAAIQRKIGYPDKLRGYAGLDINRKSYFENAARADGFSTARDLKDIGQKVDKTRWGMTPPTVNAYYNPNFNEIVFPAGILQPPFFDFKADDALNYGGIGAVIGHEMTHGFDDQGSQFDAEGNLKMWWTPEDRKKFDEKTDCVASQFSGYEFEKGMFLNGKLTLGENLADLGGLAIAYDALQKSMQGKPRPANIDGFTPEQRFFLGWAQVWAENDRPEFARLIAQSNPHSLSQFRANGPLSNMPQFAEAFSCKIGDRMVRATNCKVW